MYDISGGLQEYQMSVLQYNNEYIYTGNDDSDNSGFIGYYSTSLFNGVEVPSQKYYNRYTSSSLSIACNGAPCIGHGWSNEVGNGIANGEYNNWGESTMYLPRIYNGSWSHRGNLAYAGSALEYLQVVQLAVMHILMVGFRVVAS